MSAPRLKVGIEILESDLTSVRNMFHAFYEAVAARHDPVFLPSNYSFVSPAEQRRMEDEMVRSVDVIAGWPRPALAAARTRNGVDVPLIRFFLGEISYGAWHLKSFMEHLNTRDVFLVNCQSDVVLARKLFQNMPVDVVPFPFDPAAFAPLSAEERREARAKLGIGENDRVLLYVGRIIPEKNVHLLLRSFGTVLRHVPGAHLVLVGSAGSGDTLHTFAMQPAGFGRTIARIIESLGLPPGHVHQVGELGPGRLRELYGMADLKVNLSQNPDENFGLAQIEALACGTPVVGTAWGGLKDSIVDGVTGWQVSALSTPTGPRASWWEVVNRIVTHLNAPPPRERLAAELPAHVERCSHAAFVETIDEIVRRAAASRGRPSQPLRATAFAEEFWEVCDVWTDRSAQFRRGPRSEQLHQELLTPYSGATGHHVAPGEPMRGDQVLTLATPVREESEGVLRLDNVFYAHPVAVPEALRDGVRAVLGVMRREPAITVDRLACERLHGDDGVWEALAWMEEMGLVLRTHPVDGWIDPATVEPTLGEPVFSMRTVELGATDFVVFQ